MISENQLKCLIPSEVDAIKSDLAIYREKIAGVVEKEKDPEVRDVYSTMYNELDMYIDRVLASIDMVKC